MFNLAIDAQDEGILRASNMARAISAYQKYGKSVKNKVCYEVGVGKQIAPIIAFALLGMKKIITTDIARCLAVSDLDQVLKLYQKYATNFNFPHQIPEIPTDLSSKDLGTFLEKQFHINYLAPYDTNHVDLDDASVDFVYSNCAFEHMQYDNLCSVIAECYRVLKPGGVFWCNIDYKDHDAIYDSHATIYDFLADSPWEYAQKHKKELLFQNRLRHSDYVNLFQKYGFLLQEIIPWTLTADDEAQFKRIKIAKYFRHYSRDDLKQIGADFVLQKPLTK